MWNRQLFPSAITSPAYLVHVEAQTSQSWPQECYHNHPSQLQAPWVSSYELCGHLWCSEDCLLVPLALLPVAFLAPLHPARRILLLFWFCRQIKFIIYQFYIYSMSPEADSFNECTICLRGKASYWIHLILPFFPFSCRDVCTAGQQRKKEHFRTQILECSSIDEYWNIFGFPVLPKKVIFTFFRMCWQHFFFFFLLSFSPGCSFRCNHLFSHEAQGRNVPNSLTVGMGFTAYMFRASHKQWEVAILILINTSAAIKFRIVKMDDWLNLNKRPCWDSIRDPFASEANPWNIGLRYLSRSKQNWNAKMV